MLAQLLPEAVDHLGPPLGVHHLAVRQLVLNKDGILRLEPDDLPVNDFALLLVHHPVVQNTVDGRCLQPVRFRAIGVQDDLASA